MAELTSIQFQILRTAVNVARDEQIRSVSLLRQKLLVRYPKKPKSIEVAIQFWADYEGLKVRHR